jgi:hypothetical protein
MKQSRKVEPVQPVQPDRSEDTSIATYAQAQPPAFRMICEVLHAMLTKDLPKASARVWHGGPVWFIADNPVVGYSATAKTVNLLFWNGQAFAEPDLKPVGKYRAAQAVFKEAAEIDPKVIRRWLKKAREDVFDSNAFFKELRAAKKKNEA